MSFQKVGTLLHRSVQRAGISRQLKASMICEQADKEIKRIFGEKVGSQAKALYFKDKVLTLAVLSPVLGQEIRFRESEIIRVLNGRFGEGMVERLRYLM